MDATAVSGLIQRNAPERGREVWSSTFMIIAPSLFRRIVLGAALVVQPGLVPPGDQATTTQVEEGWATFYAQRRAGRRTASGERYDPKALVAAHPTLAFGTQVRVTRLATGASVVVRVIDRGPGRAERRRGYIIDLSRAAAESLAFVSKGRARVRIEVIVGRDKRP
jgi:rare lipoprotein A